MLQVTYGAVVGQHFESGFEERAGVKVTDREKLLVQM